MAGAVSGNLLGPARDLARAGMPVLVLYLAHDGTINEQSIRGWQRLGAEGGERRLHEWEEGEQILADADGHASETGLEITHERDTAGPFFHHDPVCLSQSFPKVGVVIDPLRVAHDGDHGRDGMSHLLVRLQDTVRSRLDPIVQTTSQGLGCRPFQHHLPTRVALDGSAGFVVSANAQDAYDFIAAKVHLFHG